MTKGRKPVAPPMNTPSFSIARIISHGDSIAQYQRDIVGNSARIHIPLKDVVSLRDIAKGLRMLASALEVLSHDTKAKDWEVLFQARTKIKLVDRLIREGKAGKE